MLALPFRLGQAVFRAKNTGTAVTECSLPQHFSIPIRRSVGSSRRIVRSHQPSIAFDPVITLSLCGFVNQLLILKLCVRWPI